MTEEKNGVKNGEANTEMAPQEDGTKVPLTNNDAGPEVKFTAGENPPNGDAKVDIGTGPTFSGLSKEDLMKYSDDPFWVRLRWFLFILFWLGWVFMLVVAIVIIVKAPRCAPKETLEWVQESAMVDYDVQNPLDVDANGTTTPEDMLKMAEALGVTTVYLRNLINPLDFEALNADYDAPQVMAILKAAKDSGNLHVVTDFVPTQVDPENNWFKSGNMTEFFKPNSSEFDFMNKDLLEKLKEVLRDSWVTKGVQGFLMAAADTEGLRNARTFLNQELKDVDGAVVSNVTDMSNELVSGFDAGMYRNFLDEHVGDWSYYKYNPKVAEGTIPDLVHLVTMTLFLVPGTPVLHGFDETYLESVKDTINKLSMLRKKESVQVGDITYANNTQENVIAFARFPVLKGTPGYAVAINMHEVNSTVVDFTSIEGVPGKGEVHLLSTLNGTESGSANTEKKDLNSIFLGPLEGIILQFVPDL